MFAAGCALDEVDDSIDVQAIAGGGGCTFGCGVNSPEINHLGVHDFHARVGGAKNANGFFVTKIERTSCTTAPVVCSTKAYDRIVSISGRLTASGPSGSITGANVKDLVIRLSNANDGGKYVLTIADVGRTVRLWSKNPVFAGFENWPQYEIKWDIERPAGQKMDWKPVCTNPPNDGSPDLLGMNQFHTLVFEDDEIDATYKLMKGPRVGSNWINLGCAGHALAKMVLTGNVTATKTAFGYTASNDDMQAMLKMWAADYTGKGIAFTVAGEPLSPLTSVLTYPAGGFKKEALWTHKGVSCLNTPRVIANPTPLGAATFPTLEADIVAANGGTRPPFCADADPFAMNGHYVVSSNPL